VTDPADRAEEALRSLHLAVRSVVTVPPPATVRRRAERGTVRRAVVVLLAAVAAVAVGVGLGTVRVADRVPPSPPPPTASASTTPGPPSLRAAALDAADLGAGYSVDAENPRPRFPGGTIPRGVCAAWSRPAVAVTDYVRDGYSVTFKAPRGHYDGHEVWRFDNANWAATAMREVQDWLRTCRRQDGGVDPGVTGVSEWTVLAAGFAGAESIAVRHTQQRNGTVSNVDFYVVVRHGDLIGALWLSDQRWTPESLLNLGRALAARLCAAGRTC
jgi:hypothetical protein